MKISYASVKILEIIKYSLYLTVELLVKETKSKKILSLRSRQLLK